MVKAGSLRKRYILFIVNAKIDSQQFKKWIYESALRFFGEYGFSKTAFKLIEFDGQEGMIRCERSHLDQTLGFLALLKNPRVIVKKVSGTIKGLTVKFKIKG